MEMIVNEERKDMDPVTIGMMIPAFEKANEDSLNVSEDMVIIEIDCLFRTYNILPFLFGLSIQWAASRGWIF